MQGAVGQSKAWVLPQKWRNKEQVKVAACPRNQRYLHPGVTSTGVLFCTEIENSGEVPHEVDVELAVDRDKADLVDQAAENYGGVGPRVVLIERIAQVLYFLPVDLCQVGVEPYGRRRFGGEVLLQGRLPFFEGFQLG